MTKVTVIAGFLMAEFDMGFTKTSLLLKLHRIPVITYTNLFPFFMGTAFSSVLFFLFLSPRGTKKYEYILKCYLKTLLTL